jgi:hypothetical protein
VHVRSVRVNVYTNNVCTAKHDCSRCVVCGVGAVPLVVNFSLRCSATSVIYHEDLLIANEYF